MAKRKTLIRHAQIVDVFAERLRSLREARDMTQRELARRAHVTITYISKLESGGAAPGIDLVERIASALSVHVTELLPSIQGELAKVQREQIETLFGSILSKAGRETSSLLVLLLSRIAESPSVSR